MLRPSDGSGFIATVNADVDTIKQNRFFLTQHNYFIGFFVWMFSPSFFNYRWPVPEAEWRHPSTNDDSDTDSMWPRPVTRTTPLSEFHIKTPSGYDLDYK